MIQAFVLALLQTQPSGPVTVTCPDSAPEPWERVVGVMEKVHVAGFWVSVNTWLATWMIPVRA
jgi:hypothetical protein